MDSKFGYPKVNGYGSITSGSYLGIYSIQNSVHSAYRLRHACFIFLCMGCDLWSCDVSFFSNRY